MPPVSAENREKAIAEAADSLDKAARGLSTRLSKIGRIPLAERDLVEAAFAEAAGILSDASQRLLNPPRPVEDDD